LLSLISKFRPIVTKKITNATVTKLCQHGMPVCTSLLILAQVQVLLFFIGPKVGS
jgi:hypothetical protein